MTQDASAGVALAVARYLACRADADAGRELLGLMAPDAAMLVGGRGAPAATLEPSAYEAAHHSAVVAHDAGGLPLAAIALRRWTPDPGTADQGTAVFELAIAGLTDAPCLAVGARFDAGTWRLAWLALLPADANPDFATGRALAAAVFPFLENVASPPRDWLDVAYDHHMAPLPPPMAFLPEARFGCAGSTDCCHGAVGQILLPPEAQAFLDALPFPDVDRRLPVLADGNLQLLPLDGTCRLLDDQGRCRVHAWLGSPVFMPCVAYPLRFTTADDRVDVTTMHSCGTVRGNFGPRLTERLPDMQARYAVAGPSFHAKPLLRHDRPVDWEVYRAVEADLLAALQLTALPLHRRLWIGARLLAAHQDGTARSFDAFGLEVLEPTNEHEREFAALVVAHPYAIFAMLDDRLAPGIAGVSRTTRLRDEAAIARWFENIIFAKEFSSKLGLVLTYTILVLLYGFLLALDAAEPAGGLPMAEGNHETVIRDKELMQMLGRSIDHRVLLDGALAKLATELPGLVRILEEPETVIRLLRHHYFAARQAEATRQAETAHRA